MKLSAMLLAAAFFAPAAAAPAVQVMIVGMFHMSNPDRDLYDVHADDMLAPKRQAEIAAVTEALARFHPTLVAVEWSAEKTDTRYAQYRAGTLAPSPNEVVQLGFRLAKRVNLDRVYGIDADGDFPWDAVQTFAKAHGQDALVQELLDRTGTDVNRVNDVLAHGTVAATLRVLNSRASVDEGQTFYRELLRVGSGNEQPGAVLLTDWFGRNAQICARLVQVLKPGDRAVVFFGAGHAFYLRQCASEMPGFRLVEADDWLPE